MAAPQTQAKDSRSIPVSRDLLYQARKEFPGYEDQAALTLFMIDQLQKQQEIDQGQSKLISVQKGENDKLKNALIDLNRELDTLEKDSIDNDKEIERLKQLTARLKPAGELTQKSIEVSSKEIERIEQELINLKSKPGMDTGKYNELNDKIQNIIKMPGVTDKEIKELEKIIQKLEKENVITRTVYADTKNELDAKEERFKKYIAKKGTETRSQAEQIKSQAEEIKKYADIFNKYKDDIQGFDQFVSSEKARLNKTISDTEEKYKEFIDFVDYSKQNVDASQQAQQAISTAQEKSRQQGPSILSPAEQIRRQKEKEKHLQNVAQTSKNPIIPIDINESTDVQPKKRTGNDAYDRWLEDNLPLLVKTFKVKFEEQLENEKTNYGDKQIAEMIEKYAQHLWNSPSEILTKEELNKFLNVVKVDLFNQPVYQVQYPLDLKENLGKTYEHMLDQLIGLKYL